MKNFSWYDVKTKIKQSLRAFLYLEFVQEIIAYIIVGYLYLVYLTSRKNISIEPSKLILAQERSIIMLTWHNRLMMAVIAYIYLRKTITNHETISLSSNHGDGKFVGRVMEKLKVTNIYGSTSASHKVKKRGIGLSSMRTLMKKLQSKSCVIITPDGPRGPNQKINGSVVEIAKMTNSLILPFSSLTSNYIKINSWDQFKIPLPFSKINIFCSKPIDLALVEAAYDKQKINEILEKSLNEIQEETLIF